MSGLKGDHIVYVRAVATCKGNAAAFMGGVAQADLYAQDTLTIVHNLLHALPGRLQWIIRLRKATRVICFGNYCWLSDDHFHEIRLRAALRSSRRRPFSALAPKEP